MEINGDVGATASCALYVDGAEADRATGVWVDRAGIVTCAFIVSFATAGTRTLAVAAENVVPGDWDSANNVAEGTIEIVEDAGRLVGSMSASDITHEHIRAWNYQANYPDFEYATRQTGRSQGYSLQGGPVGGSIAEPARTVELTESSDGVTLRSHSFELSESSWWMCGYAWIDGVSVQVCSNGFNVHRSAGDVTFFSSNYAR